MNENLNFDEWFDLFKNETRKLNYNGPIDKYTFENDYEEGKSPEISAEEFVKEMEN